MAEGTSPRSHKKAKQGLVPEFRNRFGALTRSAPPNTKAVLGLEPEDRNRFGGLTPQRKSSGDDQQELIPLSGDLTRSPSFLRGTSMQKLGNPSDESCNPMPQVSGCRMTIGNARIGR